MSWVTRAAGVGEEEKNLRRVMVSFSVIKTELWTADAKIAAASNWRAQFIYFCIDDVVLCLWHFVFAKSVEIIYVRCAIMLQSLDFFLFANGTDLRREFLLWWYTQKGLIFATVRTLSSLKDAVSLSSSALCIVPESWITVKAWTILISVQFPRIPSGPISTGTIRRRR